MNTPYFLRIVDRFGDEHLVNATAIAAVECGSPGGCRIHLTAGWAILTNMSQEQIAKLVADAYTNAAMLISPAMLDAANAAPEAKS